MPRRNKSIKHIKTLFSFDCAAKRKYINEREAAETADYQMLINPTLQLTTYQCDLCHKWHLTRQTKIN